MDKVSWYTSGFENFGWRVRFAIWIVKLLYRCRLISEEDVKVFVDQLITAWFIHQARKRNLKVVFVGQNQENKQ